MADEFDTEGLSESEVAILEEGYNDDESSPVAPQEEEGNSQEGTQESKNQVQKSEEAKAGEEEGTQQNLGGPANSSDRPQDYVPHQALHQERSEHQNTKATLAGLQGQLAAIAERLAINGAPQQQNEMSEETPDKLEDPIAYMEYQDKQIEKLANWQNQQSQQQHQQQQQHQADSEQQRVFTTVTDEYNAAAAVDPELEQAFGALQQNVVRQAQAHGLQGQQLNEYVTAQARQVALYAHSKGMPIAAYVKSLATASGWTPQAPQDPNNSQPNTANQAIDKINQAQKTNKSLNGAGATGGQTTLDDLAKLSGEDLEKFINKNADVFDGLMGG